MKTDKEVKNSFSVLTLEIETDGYSHWSEGLIMYIQKNGTIIKLESEEIKQLVESLPGTIGGSY